MPNPLRCITSGGSLLITFCLTCGVAHAAKVVSVEIVGLDEAMTENVRASLSLQDAIGKETSGRRLAYLLREARHETREALEPFGYYSPTIVVQRTRDGATEIVPDPRAAADAPIAAPPRRATALDGAIAATERDDGSEQPDAADAAAPQPPSDRAGNGGRGDVSVTITVDPGEPVRVRDADVAILGDGTDDRYLREELAAFEPRAGDVFDHARYEGSKTRISRRLAERGYFDADFSSRRVEVTRAESAADIELVWDSGQRYDMGPTTFTQTPERVVRDDLLEKLVYWEEGQYYHQGRLDRLRRSLVALDYFSRIEIDPRPEAAVDRRVPVTVTLTPAKRDVYTAGLSYGTDSGAGIRLGLERRYVNQRGHKALAQLDFAQNRSTLTLQYRIPAFAWLDGWYTVSLQGADEQTDYIDTRRVELVGSRSGQFNRYLNLVASLHVLRERWAYAYEDDGDPDTPPLYRYATFTYPSLRGEYIDVDDRLFPRRGYSGTLTLRAGAEGVGSDANFAQVHARANWFKGVGARDRLIVRGEIGRTFTDALIDVPPSLRFYAGGDRSVRGYEWREIGPRVAASEGRRAFALGAKNVVTGSVEYERYFNDSWGAAVFVDSGSAWGGTRAETGDRSFDSPDFRTGVGVGVRWKSPVGPLKFDIARGLDDPDSGFTIGLNIGADLL